MQDDKPGGEAPKEQGRGDEPSVAEKLQIALEKAGEKHRKAAQDYDGKAAALGKADRNGDSADQIVDAKKKAEGHWDKAGKDFNRAGNIKFESGQMQKTLLLFQEAAKCYAQAKNKDALEKKKETIKKTKQVMEEMKNKPF